MGSVMPSLTPLLPLHLGELHPYEQALTLLLAFGPFVVLGVVVWLRRRSEARRPQQVEDGQPESQPQGQPQGQPRSRRSVS